MPESRPDLTSLIREINDPMLMAARLTMVTNNSASLHSRCITENSKLAINATHICVLMPTWRHDRH